MSDGLPNSSAGPPRMGARWPNLSAGPLRMTDGLPNSSAGLPRMGARWPDLSAGPPEPSVFAESSMVHETGETSGFHELGTLPETSTESTFRTPDGSTTKRPIQISAIGGHPFRQLAYKQKLTIFSAVQDQPSARGGRPTKGTKEGAGSEELHSGGVPRVSATIFGSFGKEPTNPPAL